MPGGSRLPPGYELSMSSAATLRGKTSLVVCANSTAQDAPGIAPTGWATSDILLVTSGRWGYYAVGTMPYQQFAKGITECYLPKQLPVLLSW